MKNTKRIFAQAVCAFLLLVWLCSLTANAQNRPPKDIPEGYSLIDGDILMPTWFVDSVLRGETPEAAYRTNLWTNGAVFYEFDANVTPANRTIMINAMAVLTNVANVRFIRCEPDCGGSGNYAHIQNSTANNSQVGMVGGQQVINITSWNSQFIIVHELLHCLGIYHEHVRPDRNTFVQINCNNVQGGCNGTIFNNNFVIPGDGSGYGYYDFDSVMHYDQCSFSTDCPAGATCNCTNTVITVLPPNQGWQTLIGQRNYLSALDRATISFLYPQSNWRFLDCSYTGPAFGTFREPYKTLPSALANTPAGGTLWITGPCLSGGIGTYGSPVTIKTAPGVPARFGSP